MTDKNIEERLKDVEEKVAELMEYHEFNLGKSKKVVVRLKGFDMKREAKFDSYLWNTREFPYNPLSLGCTEIPERAVHVLKSKGYDIVKVNYEKLLNDEKFTKNYGKAADKYLGLDANL